MTSRSLVLIDGTQVLHRVLHAEAAQPAYSVPEDTIDVRGMTSFIGVLRPFLNAVKPARAVVVWDGGGWSKRRLSIYPEYKAQRLVHETEEKALAHQKHFERFREQRAFLEVFLEMLCIPTLKVPGKEADDVIANIALSEVSHSKVTVFSDDGDFRQLVCKGVETYRPSTKSFFTKATKSPDNISHEHYLLFKACLGDPSDNIKGIPGVGEKTLSDLFPLFKGKTPGEFYDFVSEHRGEGARLDKILDNFAVVFRNMHLMDLTLESFTPEEQQQMDCVVSTLAGSMVFHQGKVEMTLRKYGMKRALENFTYWAEPFVQLGVSSRFSRT